MVAAAPSYPTRMAFRIMLRTGLGVSEALSLHRNDLRLNQDPRCQRPAEGPGQQGPQGPRGADPCGPAGKPGRPGVVPPQGPQPSHAGHLPPVGWGEHEASGHGCRDRSSPSLPPRLPPHLRPQLRPMRSAAADAAAVTGTSVPGRHPALCGVGRRPSFMGRQVVNRTIRTENAFLGEKAGRRRNEAVSRMTRPSN